jgi:hypothetical protein
VSLDLDFEDLGVFGDEALPKGQPASGAMALIGWQSVALFLDGKVGGGAAFRRGATRLLASLPRFLRPLHSRLVPSPATALLRFTAEELPLKLADLGPKLLEIPLELLFSVPGLLVPTLPVTCLLAGLEDLGFEGTSWAELRFPLLGISARDRALCSRRRSRENRGLGLGVEVHDLLVHLPQICVQQKFPLPENSLADSVKTTTSSPHGRRLAARLAPGGDPLSCRLSADKAKPCPVDAPR